MRKVLFKKLKDNPNTRGENSFFNPLNYTQEEFDGFFHRWVIIKNDNGSTFIIAIIEDVNGRNHTLPINLFRFNDLNYSNETQP